MRTTMTFDEVSLTDQKSGICPVCNKRAVRWRKFWQTINPYNRNPDGSIKTRNDIYNELSIERNTWLSEPVYHVKCEPPENWEE